MTELLLAFGAGLLSSLHCVGMCGPIVMGCSVAPEPVQITVTGSSAIVNARKSFVVPQLLYHSGRIVSYSTLGMLAGLFGAAAVISPQVQRPVTIGLGVLMILAALFQLDLFKRRSTNAKPGKAITILGTIVKSSSNESRFLIGVMTPLLPCGLLYGMLLHSAALTSPLLAATSMSFFALGAVPALIALATVSNRLSVRLRKNGTRFAAVFIIAMGFITILRGAGLYNAPLTMHTDSECAAPQQTTFSK